MKVALDLNRCQGHARCALLAPDVFDLDENGLGTVKAEQVPPEFAAQAREAQFSCPERAITLTDG